MTTIIDRHEAPSHLFSIPELDFSEDLFTERAGGPWFRLGAWTAAAHRDERGVEDEVSRQSFLLAPNCFVDIFDKLQSVGNLTHNLGKPGGWVHHAAEHKEYRYAPFHRFEIPFTSAVGEPLVFVHSSTAGDKLFINPDLCLRFELEEKTNGSGIWWDPRRGVDALIRSVTDRDNLEVVEIRLDHLLKYLQARQMSLVVGHYRHLRFLYPSATATAAFVEGDVTLGSPEQRAKAMLQNLGLRQDITTTTPYLLRRLHLWFEVTPPPINIDDPWADQPSFDPYTFTLPTGVRPVAPAAWKIMEPTDGRTFEGKGCDFMDRVCFRQEVLSKYEGASGFEVEDDGSVRCRHYWGLTRSTVRVGNELLATAIGDFAEGVPFEEWPHWKQYAVEPPSPETASALAQEQSVPDAVNALAEALYTLNTAFAGAAASLRVANLGSLWCGSLDSLAGRQLKWVYPASADDDEFLKRATLASTLVIEALDPKPVRKLLRAVGSNLHKDGKDQHGSLGSRNLLQRLTLIAVLIENFQTSTTEIPMLVRQAEGNVKNTKQPDLQTELETLHRRVRREFAPLAFLYDLRTFGGMAHAPNTVKAAALAPQLGLPEKNWHRTDYLRLLNLVADSVRKVSNHLDIASRLITRGGLSEAE